MKWHWLLWWKIDPAELRRQMDGYATMPRLTTARGFGCLLSAILAASWAFLAASAYIPEDNIYHYFSYSAMTYAIWYFVLGCLLLRGSRVAMVGLMALVSVSMLVFIFSYRYFENKLDYAIYLVSFGVGWTVYMHALYNALCVERERRR